MRYLNKILKVYSTSPNTPQLAAGMFFFAKASKNYSPKLQRRRMKAKVEPYEAPQRSEAKFWSVVGLGIRLRRMNHSGVPLRYPAACCGKVHFLVLILSAIAAFSGCVTEYNLATQKQETLLYDTEKEIKIGETVAPKIEAQYKVVTDVDVNARVERILARIVAVCDRKDLVYFIKVLDDDPVNAVSLPGGYIYVFRGLIERVENDDQLAGVIAHEVGHITAKHGVKRMQNAYAALLLQIAAAQTNAGVAGGTNLALTSLFLEYSQQAEFEADRLSVKYLKKAGYDPKGIVAFLEKLKADQEKEPLKQYSYWRTHPYLSKRISVSNQAISGKLEFRDYLNLIGND